MTAEDGFFGSPQPTRTTATNAAKRFMGGFYPVAEDEEANGGEVPFAPMKRANRTNYCGFCMFFHISAAWFIISCRCSGVMF